LALVQVIHSLPERAEVELLMQKAFGSPVRDCELIGEGAESFVQLVHLEREPHQVAVKWMKHHGHGETMVHQLRELRKHAGDLVPEVYFYHTPTDDLRQEACVMEYVPGIPASNLQPPPQDVQERLANETIEHLLRWHAVRNPRGYGSLDGPFHSRWIDYYLPRVLETRGKMGSEDGSSGKPSELAIQVADRSIDAAEKVLGHIRDNAVLNHGDIWMPNVLVDPETVRVLAIIDPVEADWSEAEMDLIPMYWPWGDGDYLMKVYRQHVELDEGFDLRFAFYHFWWTMRACTWLGWHYADGGKAHAKALDEALLVIGC
jgi:fructosamine-3-kinase